MQVTVTTELHLCVKRTKRVPAGPNKATQTRATGLLGPGLALTLGPIVLSLWLSPFFYHFTAAAIQEMPRHVLNRPRCVTSSCHHLWQLDLLRQRLNAAANKELVADHGNHGQQALARPQG